jgi:hypothetical protein
MSQAIHHSPLTTHSSLLIGKIARLVEERGWNQEDFARITQLNRQTVRQILLQNGQRRLQNATVSACARALGLSVSELRDQPLEQLLIRMRNPECGMRNPQYAPASEFRTPQSAFQSQPELQAWLEAHPERASQFTAEEIDELNSLQGTGGPLTAAGVEHFATVIERKRRLLQQIHALAGTEYLELLEILVGLLYEKVQPYGDRV